jgi:hypothetical protein
MKYLVLRTFRSFGKQLTRGTLIDETEVRSPRIRISEGKITPAVSSSDIPDEPVEVEETSTGSQETPDQKVENKHFSFSKH